MLNYKPYKLYKRHILIGDGVISKKGKIYKENFGLKVNYKTINILTFSIKIFKLIIPKNEKILRSFNVINEI